MYLLLTILFLFTGACSEALTPEERGIKLTECSGDTDCNPYVSPVIGVTNQSKAMFTAQFLVEDAYGIDFGTLSQDATVYWADTICPKDGQYKIIYGNECNYGRMWSCNEMYVALSNGDPKTTCGSALLHEFGHCMYMEKIDVNHQGCPNHSDDYFWGIIKKANETSCSRGW